jgi:hypothetical protein
MRKTFNKAILHCPSKKTLGLDSLRYGLLCMAAPVLHKSPPLKLPQMAALAV